MSTPQIRTGGVVVPTPATGTTLSMSTPSGTAVGDLLVLFHFYDYHTASDMLTPTAPSGSWTLQATGDSGSNQMHVKVWTRVTTSAGTQTVTVASTPSDATHMPVLFVLDGTAASLSVDGVAGSNGTSTTAHVCPSVTTTGSDNLLLCGAGESPFGAGDYSWPGSMTERSDADAGSFSTASTATEVLSASGATGTRTATCTVTEDFCSATISIKGTASGTTAPAENAAGTGAANQSVTLIQANSEAAAPSGAALDAGPNVRPVSSEAAASASAPFDSGGGSISLTLISDAAVGTTGVAHDPTVLIGSTTQAEVAAATAAALDAVVRITFDAGEASGTSVAYDITPAMGVYAESASVTGEGFDLTAEVPVAQWRLVMPKTTDYWTVSGSLRVSIQREATVFGNDSTLYTSFDGVLSGGGDADGAIPFTTKYIWFGGHDNVTADSAIRDLWVANGFTVQEV